MAGASCDDIFVIVLFSTFTGMAQGNGAKLADFLNIPVSIALGVAAGAIGIDALAPRLLNDGAAIPSSQTAQRQ